MYTTRIATMSSTHKLPSEFWKALAAPWKLVLMVSGSVSFASFWISSTTLAQRSAWLQIERNRDRVQLPVVIDGLRSDVLMQLGKRVQRNQLARCRT